METFVISHCVSDQATYTYYTDAYFSAKSKEYLYEIILDKINRLLEDYNIKHVTYDVAENSSIKLGNEEIALINLWSVVENKPEIKILSLDEHIADIEKSAIKI
jgi:hypothetical protein